MLSEAGSTRYSCNVEAGDTVETGTNNAAREVCDTMSCRGTAGGDDESWLQLLRCLPAQELPCHLQPRLGTVKQ
jgi:hypothetical protein